MSISREVFLGTLRFAFPVSPAGVHVAPLRSSSATARPLVASCAFQSPSFFAQATWLEPGPWQASHDTSISDHVVWNVSVLASKFLRRFVEWHSEHMKFQFCPDEVQCR